MTLAIVPEPQTVELAELLPLTGPEVRLQAEERALDLERGLLGSMLAHWSARPRQAARLQATEFIAPLHGKLYLAVWNLRQRGIEPCAQVLAPTFKHDPDLRQLGGVAYLNRLINCTPVEGGDETGMAEAVRAEAQKRRLHQIAAQLAELALDPELTAAEAIQKVRAELEEVRAGGALAVTTLRDVAGELASQLIEAPNVVSTGIPRLDTALGGGLHQGRLYAFAARMGHGKTLTLGTLARNVASPDCRALYVCMEMGQEEIAQRMLCADLEENAVRFLKRDRPDFVERFIEHAPNANQHLLFVDRPGLTHDGLMNILAQHAVREGVKVFFVDYWQLVGGQKQGETEVAHLQRVAKDMADFVKQFKVTIVTAAQINREGHTRGGDGLKMACDLYLHMHIVPSVENMNKPTEIWMGMEKTRYTVTKDIGSEEQPAFFIDKRGPVLAQWGQ